MMGNNNMMRNKKKTLWEFKNMSNAIMGMGNNSQIDNSGSSTVMSNNNHHFRTGDERN